MSFDAFDHDDYRELIRSWIAARPARSQSMLARRVGSSRSKVAMVLSGAREIALNEVQAWADGLDLDGDAAVYFGLLVRADSPVSLELRRRAHTQARSMQQMRWARHPTQEQARWLSRWFVGLTVELARLPDFEPDPEVIAARLWPDVPVDEVREGLRQLDAMGFLDAVRTDPSRPVSTGKQLGKELSRFGTQYHHTQLDHASQALDEQAPEDRFFFSSQVGIRESDMPALTDALARFQMEVVERFRAPIDADRLVQISLNMFSRTRTVCD